MTPKPIAQSEPAAEAARNEDEITRERRVQVPPAARPSSSARLTTRMHVIDAKLLAIARGEAEPDGPANHAITARPRNNTATSPPGNDAVTARPANATDSTSPSAADDLDPFGGLIPVYEQDEAATSDAIDSAFDDAWRTSDPAPSVAGLRAVPRVLMRQEELLRLPCDARHGFVLCQIDGTRAIAEIADICRLGDAEALDVFARLVALGAVELRASRAPP